VIAKHSPVSVLRTVLTVLALLVPGHLWAQSCTHLGGQVVCPNNPGTGQPLPAGSSSVNFVTGGTNWQIAGGGTVFIPQTVFTTFVATTTTNTTTNTTTTATTTTSSNTTAAVSNGTTGQAPRNAGGQIALVNRSNAEMGEAIGNAFLTLFSGGGAALFHAGLNSAEADERAIDPLTMREISRERQLQVEENGFRVIQNGSPWGVDAASQGVLDLPEQASPKAAQAEARTSFTLDPPRQPLTGAAREAAKRFVLQFNEPMELETAEQNLFTTLSPDRLPTAEEKAEMRAASSIAKSLGDEDPSTAKRAAESYKWASPNVRSHVDQMVKVNSSALARSAIRQSDAARATAPRNTLR
jgi:hypothetical protein